MAPAVKRNDSENDTHDGENRVLQTTLLPRRGQRAVAQGASSLRRMKHLSNGVPGSCTKIFTGMQSSIESGHPDLTHAVTGVARALDAAPERVQARGWLPVDAKWLRLSSTKVFEPRGETADLHAMKRWATQAKRNWAIAAGLAAKPITRSS